MEEPVPQQKPVPELYQKLAVSPTHVRYQVLAFACVLAVATYLQRLGFFKACPEIMESLHFDSRHIGKLSAAFLIAYGLFQVPGGLLADRFGGRTVLTTLVFVWSLLIAAVSLTVFLPSESQFALFGSEYMLPTQFGFLIVVIFAFGAFQAGGFPVLGRIMADWMRLNERGLAQGTIWTISRLGGFIVPFAFTGLYRQSGSWAFPLVLFGSLGLLWCGFFWPWFRNRPEEKQSVNAVERASIAAGRAAVPSVRSTPPWSRMARSLSAWSLCLMYGCVGFSGNFFTSMLHTYLRQERNLSGIVEDWLAALPLGAGAVSCILGGLASDWIIRRSGNRRWGRRAVGLVGPALAAVAFFFVPRVSETWLLGVLLTVTFFGNDLIMGPAWASCADVGERFAGTLSGAMNMTGAFAGAGAMYLLGYLIQKQSGWYNPPLMFAIFSGSYALAALCWFGVDATQRISEAA
jgi:sugar phosphate permease